jgi:transcriptional regulator of acetoin/glycerol metabolism
VTRQVQAELRRQRLVELLVAQNDGPTDWGIQAKLARALGVHRSTVCRDLKAFRLEFWLARSRRRAPSRSA